MVELKEKGIPLMKPTFFKKDDPCNPKYEPSKAVEYTGIIKHSIFENPSKDWNIDDILQPVTDDCIEDVPELPISIKELYKSLKPEQSIIAEDVRNHDNLKEHGIKKKVKSIIVRVSNRK